MEGCGYRDRQSEFAALGVEIAGVSFADEETNLDWATEESFNYDLWSDEDRVLAMHYGAANGPNAFAPKRITMLLDENGDVILEYVSDVDVAAHPGQVLEDCQAIFGP